MKKAISLFAILLMLFTQLKVFATPKVGFDSISISPNEQFEIEFSVGEKLNYIAYQMDIFYDDDIINPISVTKVSGSGQLMYNIKADERCISLVYASIEAEDSESILFKILILATEKSDWETVNLGIDNFKMFDADGNVINTDIKSGIITKLLKQESHSSEEVSHIAQNSDYLEKNSQPTLNETKNSCLLIYIAIAVLFIAVIFILARKCRRDKLQQL